MIEKIDWKKMAENELVIVDNLRIGINTYPLFNDFWVHDRAVMWVRNNLSEVAEFRKPFSFSMDLEDFQYSLEGYIIQENKGELERAQEKVKKGLEILLEWDKELDRMLQKKSTLS